MRIKHTKRIRRGLGMVFGSFFALAAILKVPELTDLVDGVQQIFPLGWFASPMVLAVFILEFMVGCGLLFKFKERACWLAVFFLLSIFTVWLGYGLISGAFESCGCFGDLLHISLEWSIARNLLLLAISATIYYQMLSHDEA